MADKKYHIASVFMSAKINYYKSYHYSSSKKYENLNFEFLKQYSYTNCINQKLLYFSTALSSAVGTLYRLKVLATHFNQILQYL